jgi:UDP-N-acetylglucosamine/UDP-N-acetylgalactosamine diphosphorylase
MVSFGGYEDTIKKVYAHNQDHVFEYWESLDDGMKKNLLEQLEGVDFDMLKGLFESSGNSEIENYNEAPYIPLPESDSDKELRSEAAEAGIKHIEEGKVAAFVVAGGQGSRLGYDGPKGKFPVGPVSGKTIFQIHGEKIKKYSDKYGIRIPWLIMTSRLNHRETVDYFGQCGFFGLDENDIFIFPQNMIPSLDAEGKLILENSSSIFMNPDGHGGSLTALQSSGVLGKMKDRGIETISYFQVDNPLVKIVDPVFIGFHVRNGADISSKAVKKAYPEEKMGVFVRYTSGKMGVVEYSDLPEEKMFMKDDKGELKFSSGSIAIHLFDSFFIEKITSGMGISLPFHTARKKIKAFSKNSQVEIEGYKFEKFVFDALELTEKNIIFETLREEEFAPVKNAEGVDSVDSARKLMIDLHKSWLREKSVTIPNENADIEISPLYAVEPEDISSDLKVSGDDKILIGN